MKQKGEPEVKKVEKPAEKVRNQDIASILDQN